MEKETLAAMIEELRNKLYSVSAGRQFTDHEVLRVSRQLDDLLNQYQTVNHLRHDLLYRNNNKNF